MKTKQAKDLKPGDMLLINHGTGPVTVREITGTIPLNGMTTMFVEITVEGGWKYVINENETVVVV